MNMSFQNCVDRLLASLALLAAVPVCAAIAIAILLEDRGPVFFGQTRVGRAGVPFLLWKFRSMRCNQAGLTITAEGDERVTRVGRFIRRYKLDELPQFWNVVRGELSLIGPRPEVARYVMSGNAIWQQVLSVRPGITDLASLCYRDEESELAAVADPETYYRNVLLPAKLALNLEYQRCRTVWTDWKLLLFTARYCFLRRGFDPARIRRALVTESS